MLDRSQSFASSINTAAFGERYNLVFDAYHSLAT
jgi:hypothetical protein